MPIETVDWKVEAERLAYAIRSYFLGSQGGEENMAAAFERWAYLAEWTVAGEKGGVADADD